MSDSNAARINELVAPVASFEPAKLSGSDLISLVTAAKKHNISGTLGVWNDYLKVKLPNNKLSDPSRHSREVLIGFVESLATPAPTNHINSNASVEASRGSAHFMHRYLAWRVQLVQDDAAFKTSRRAAVAACAAVIAPVTVAAETAAHCTKLAELEAACRKAQEQAAEAAATALRLQREVDTLRQEISDSARADRPGHKQAATSRLADPAYNTVASLVDRTRRHPNFQRLFGLPSYCTGWLRTPRLLPPSQPVPAPRLLALDCEMVKTDRDDNALCGVCVVDEHSQVLYKALVRPDGQVLDYRTSLTGLSWEDFKDVTLTPHEAQRAVAALLTPGSVLVGHALHHDLTALRIDHQPVIDTSMIMSFQNMRGSTPSLKDLAKAVLGIDMRTRTGGMATDDGSAGRHDSREDASTAIQLVVCELAKTGPTPPLPVPEIKVPKQDLCKLLVHALPRNCTEAELRPLLGTALQSLEGSLADRRILAVFRHAGDANDAFKDLPGKPGLDSMGRACKEVPLPGGRTFTIRKMACHNGMAYNPEKSELPRGKRPQKPKPAAPEGAEPAAASATSKGAKQGGGAVDVKAGKTGQRKGKDSGAKGGKRKRGFGQSSGIKSHKRMSKGLSIPAVPTAMHSIV